MQKARARRDRAAAFSVGAVRLARILDPRVEACRGQRLVQPLIERMARRPGQVGRGDPSLLLLVLLIPQSHA